MVRVPRSVWWFTGSCVWLGLVWSGLENKLVRRDGSKSRIRGREREETMTGDKPTMVERTLDAWKRVGVKKKKEEGRKEGAERGKNELSLSRSERFDYIIFQFSSWSSRYFAWSLSLCVCVCGLLEHTYSYSSGVYYYLCSPLPYLSRLCPSL